MRQRRPLAIWATAACFAVGCAASPTQPIVGKVEIVLPPQLQLEQATAVEVQIFDAEGARIVGTPVGVKSSEPSVVRVENDPSKPGQLRAIAAGAGQTVLSAVAGGVRGEAKVTVRCPQPTGKGLTHSGLVTRSETWRAVDGPHHVAADLTIQRPAGSSAPVEVTIQSCSQVTVAKGVSITVGGGTAAALRVLGGNSPEGRVVFQPADAGQGPGSWVGLILSERYPAGGTEQDPTTLQHAVVRGAGGSHGSDPAAGVRVEGNEGSSTLPTLTGLVVDGSAGHGIVLSQFGGISSTSTACEVTNCRLSAWRSHPDQVGNIVAGKTSGNGVDAIEVVAGAVAHSAKWNVTAVPYFISGNVSVGGWPREIPGRLLDLFLAIDAGVTLKFAKGTRLAIGMERSARSGLLVQGTTEAPVTFTSAQAQPAKGDWGGVIFGRYAIPTSVLRNAIFEYGGAPNGVAGFDGDYEQPELANLVFLTSIARSSVTGVKFRHSAGYGVARGFTDLNDYVLMGNLFDAPTLALGTQSPITSLTLSAPIAADGSLKPNTICGEGVKSPAVEWKVPTPGPTAGKGFPEKVKSFVLLVRQAGAEKAHWAVHGLSTKVTALAVDAAGTGKLPEGAVELVPFGGACPAGPPATCKQLKADCTAAKLGSCLEYEKSCVKAFRFELYAVEADKLAVGASPSLAELDAALLPVTRGIADVSATFEIP
ncbi:MAG: hypothetical protein IT371_15950 [Deltaproteobacteria bacterium]|nr:hypothetical protein [Deltaproteobacteria bacterium]